MKNVQQRFDDGEVIPLDFHEFDDCGFFNCKFVYHGYTLPSMPNCRVGGEDTSMTFDGPAANVLHWLGHMYNSEDVPLRDAARKILTAVGLPA